MAISERAIQDIQRCFYAVISFINGSNNLSPPSRADLAETSSNFGWLYGIYLWYTILSGALIVAKKPVGAFAGIFAVLLDICLFTNPLA